MASLTGAIIDGVYTKTDASKEATASSSSINTSYSKGSTGTQYDQEMFLSLLVAEMQYQDPLEPTSNTEYVSELASFTQIETVQAVQDQVQTLQANSLVGKYVIMLNDDNEYVSGKVDYVVNDGGELYLAVNNELYKIDQLDSVVDEEYYNASLISEAFVNTVKSLPELNAVTLEDEASITQVRQVYESLDSYTKNMIPNESLSKLETLEGKITALKKAKEEEEGKTDTDNNSDDTGKVDREGDS